MVNVKNVVLYDIMMCQDKPDFNLPHIGAMYGESTTVPANEEIVFLDIEGLPIDIRLDSPVDVGASVNFYINHITAIKESATDVMFGYYGIGPIRDYWTPVAGQIEDMESWQSANDVLSDIVNAQDVVFPSLYTFYNDPDGWKRYALINIMEARRISNGKPIIPFIWNRYHDSTPLAGTDIDYDFFYMQLKYLRELEVDGVALWNHPTEQWSEEKGWCQAIRQFIDDQSYFA